MTGQQQQSMTSLVCSYRKEPTDTAAGGGKNRSPFVREVCLISHQHDDDITSPLCSHIIDPFRSLLEGVHIWKRQQISLCFFFKFSFKFLFEVNISESDVNILFSLNETNTGNTTSRFQLLQWHNGPTCDIVNYNCSSRVSDVTWNEASKSLLPCSVPQLQPDLWSREVMRKKQTQHSKKKLKWARNGNKKKEKLNMHKHKMRRMDLKKNFYKEWMTPLRVSRQGLEGRRLNQ